MSTSNRQQGNWFWHFQVFTLSIRTLKSNHWYRTRESLGINIPCLLSLHRNGKTLNFVINPPNSEQVKNLNIYPKCFLLLLTSSPSGNRCYNTNIDQTYINFQTSVCLTRVLLSDLRYFLYVLSYVSSSTLTVERLSSIYSWTNELTLRVFDRTWVKKFQKSEGVKN